ncbi:hypothetical protein SNEBB_002720 [Seison nebaliae]|nr:hypothetical protein SNEBB_002720 [Seison nebaliae]
MKIHDKHLSIDPVELRISVTAHKKHNQTIYNDGGERHYKNIKLLLPQIPVDEFRDFYKNFIYVIALTNHEKVMDGFGKLFEESAQLNITFFPYMLTRQYIKFADIWCQKGGIVNHQKFVDAEKSLLKRIQHNPKEFKNIFDKRLVGIHGVTTEDRHFYSLIADLKTGRLITLDSVLTTECRKDLIAQLVGRLFERMAKSLNIPEPYTFASESFFWKLLTPHVPVQGFTAGCGYFTILNNYYSILKVLPSYRNRDMEQLRFLLVYQLFYQKIFPVLDSEPVFRD